jgi:hypothetical protein
MFIFYIPSFLEIGSNWLGELGHGLGFLDQRKANLGLFSEIFPSLLDISQGCLGSSAWAWNMHVG